jgi:hypothetical protein
MQKDLAVEMEIAMRKILLPTLASVGIALALPVLAQSSSDTMDPKAPHTNEYGLVKGEDGKYIHPYPDIDKVALEQKVVQIVQAAYGGNVFLGSSKHLPKAVEMDLVAGNMLPEKAKPRPVPKKIADLLPHSEDGTSWMRVGGHLVELDGSNHILMVVYDVLP